MNFGDDPNAIGSFYDNQAPLYAERGEKHKTSRMMLLANLPHPAPGRHVRVLDIGCGAGEMSELCRARFGDVDYVGVDCSNKMISVATSRFGHVGRFFLADAFSLIRPDAGFFWDNSTPARRFHVVLMQAVIHLYTPDVAAHHLCGALRYYARAMFVFTTRRYDTYKWGVATKSDGAQYERAFHSLQSLTALLDNALQCCLFDGWSFEIAPTVDDVGDPWFTVVIKHNASLSYLRDGFAVSEGAAICPSMIQAAYNIFLRAEEQKVDEFQDSIIRYMDNDGLVRIEGLSSADCGYLGDLVLDPGLRNLAARLMGTENANVFKDKINVGRAFPLHQDASAMWPAVPMVTIGVPLVQPSCGMGTLFVARGQHTKGLFSAMGQELRHDQLPPVVWHKPVLTRGVPYAIDPFVPHFVRAPTTKDSRPILFITYVGREKEEPDLSVRYFSAKLRRQPPTDLRLKFNLNVVRDKFNKCVRPEEVARQFAYKLDIDSYIRSCLPVSNRRIAQLEFPAFYTDVVIIGAGPAGLACARALTDQGKQKFVLIEAGSSVNCRDSYATFDSCNGVGGAGLFSDGKFSFGTAGSGSHLMTRHDDGMRRISELCAMAGFPLSSQVEENAQSPYNGMNLKAYPSIYTSLEQRKKLISLLFPQQNDIWINTRVVKVEPVFGGGMYRVETSDPETRRVIYTHSVVCATGRFPLRSGFLPISPLVFRRLEFGVRIEVPRGSPLIPRACNLIDPKLTFDANFGDHKFHVRTFCVCDYDGEVVSCGSVEGNHLAFSGRRRPSGTSLWSNFGLMIRFADLSDSNIRLYNELHRLCDEVPHLRQADMPIIVDGKLMMPAGDKLPLATHLIYTAIAEYAKRVNAENALASACIFGPCLEGFGFYPYADVNNGQLYRRPGFYMAGDATGIYRGLVPALVGGYACGLEVASL